jgi:hypothetical protein
MDLFSKHQPEKFITTFLWFNGHYIGIQLKEGFDPVPIIRSYIKDPVTFFYKPGVKILRNPVSWLTDDGKSLCRR